MFRMTSAHRIVAATLLVLATVLQTGCMTVGYSYAKDPKAVGKWDVTITKLEPQNIYNAAGVFWVGPFAKVESRGQRITFIDAKGKTQEIVQPLSDRYELHQGQHAVYIADRGQVWVQPADYPLPPEFGVTSQAATAVTYESKVHLDLGAGWAPKPLTDGMKAAGDSVYVANATIDAGVVLGAVRRSDVTDLMMYAASKQTIVVNNLKDAKRSPVTEVQVGGRQAYRFEVSGTAKTGVNVTFMGTVVGGGTEVAYLRAWTNAAAYPAQRDAFAQYSEKIVGL